MKKDNVIYLKDYQPPEFLIDSIFLHFDLDETATQVKAILQVKRNPAAKKKAKALRLDGEDMQLKSVFLNGVQLPKDAYQVDKTSLTIQNVPDEFTVETVVIINPKANTELAGLYVSRGNFCTQCESRGFRHITYFLDRPDVMTHFTTTISADKFRYPVLLSNGNLIEQKTLPDGRQWVKWQDPSLKPCYLFALVGGDLDCVSDEFTTMSGRKVELKIYVEKGKLDQAHFAMLALKEAMHWDEQRYGREYELDIYMIVAVSDFNVGAMENKGLNIFNDRYILANSKTATDDDFYNIESVIGHEYFHNWSGNRVTCRDWFQITLKEGLTIFRDQNFTGDLYSPIVERIEDVKEMRSAQFAEDQGPFAHPIRPASYIEVNNFYTVTVYHKGAEVIRMIETMLGVEKFRQGLDYYFAQYDGQAVTVEEFVKSMEKVANLNLKQFRLWYSQAGTPEVKVKTQYNAKGKTYQITLSQQLPRIKKMPAPKPLMIPISVGLIDPKTGKDLLLPVTQLLILKKKSQKFVLKNVPVEPVPSLLRNFSAPVKLNYAYSDADLAFLMQHDSDHFNRWDAGQTLATRIILNLAKAHQRKKTLQLPENFLQAYAGLFNDSSLDLSVLEQMLTLPSMAYLIEQVAVAEVSALYAAREFIKKQLAKHLHESFLKLYHHYHQTGAYQYNGKAAAQRALKNIALFYLVQTADADKQALALQQFQQADNMTDQMGALAALNNVKGSARGKALKEFYQQWQKEDLVVNKWLALQASSTLPDTLRVVKKLLSHRAYNPKNPNKIRALVGSFSMNYVHFHAANGSGYRFLAEQVLKIDKINAQVAARIVQPLIHWRKFDKKRQRLMRAQLKRIIAAKKLSKNLYEIVSKSL